MKYRRPLVAAVAAVAAISLATACTSSKSGSSSSSSGAKSSSSASGSSLGNIVNPGYTTKGGTVNLLDGDDFEHLDPVQNYVTNSGEFGRLIYRTLTFIDDTPGKTPTIKPDIAESLGTSSNGGKTWTYKLRKGLKYEDGTPITSADIKYAVERSFAQDIYKDGATYMPDNLVNTNGYAGPYDGSGKDLTSVVTADDYTIQFNFTGPQPDADWMMSLFFTAPVPKAKDTKQDYDLHPVASGPYKIADYTPKKDLKLVRNDQWDPSTDPNRPALPDAFNMTLGIDIPTISARLIADQGDDKNATTLENSGALQNGDLGKLSDPSVKARYVNGSGPCVFYDYFNETTITDPTVRKAIATAINRQAVITALGGAVFGSVTDSYMPANVRGFKAPDLGLKPTGDPAAAKALLAGKTVPTIHYGISDARPKQKAVAVEIQNDLKQAGITMVIDSIPGDSFYKTLRSSNAPDIAMAGWCSDWPTQAAVVPPVLGPDSTGKTWSSNNFSKYFDATDSAKIAALASSTDTPANIDKGFTDLSNQIQTTNWPLIPLQASLDPQVVGSNLQNAGVSSIFSEIDLNTIGVKA